MNSEWQERSNRDNRTRLSFWYPALLAAGLPTPKTHIITLDNDDLISALDSEVSLSLFGLLASISEAAEDVGTPYFLRTDYTSAKHSWRNTCYVDDSADLRSHVLKIVEYSNCVDPIGLPTDTWVVREMLNVRTLFTAFHGRMPITREYRLFVRDGVVEHAQFYWPASAFEGHHPSRDDWRETLAKASLLSLDEGEELTRLALAVSAALPGYWSVDLLETKDRGWVITDLADGDKSYMWSPE